MGITRTERAIDELDLLAEDFEYGCDDVRLAWVADALRCAGDEAGEFDALWNDR